MKILYIINNNSTGTGGHLNSLKNTIDALKPEITPLVVVIGKRTSPLFNSEYFVRFEKVSDIVISFFRLRKLVKNTKPKVIHSFDFRALFMCRILSKYFRIPLIATKCGGKTIPHPFVDVFILYSLEDYNTYKHQKKLRKSKLHYYPNRVNDFQTDKKIVDIIKKETAGKKILLRISRISNYYKKSFYQAINLVKQLNEDKITTLLVVIGTIESHELYEKLKESLSREEILIYTSKQFTVNAKRSIEAADMVLGTGRGLMEASFKNKIILTPLKESKYPALLKKENIEQLMHTNFSERNHILNFNEERNFDQIKKVLTKEEDKNKHLQEIATIREQYFNINNVRENYLRLYKEVKFNTDYHFLDFINHFKKILKFLIRNKKSS